MSIKKGTRVKSLGTTVRKNLQGTVKQYNCLERYPYIVKFDNGQAFLCDCFDVIKHKK